MKTKGKKALLVGLLAAAGMVTSCGSDDDGNPNMPIGGGTFDGVVAPIGLPQPSGSIEAAFNMLRSQIAYETSEGNAGANVVLSPFSLDAAMTMAAMGATGSTLTEICDALGWTGRTPDELGQRYRQVMSTYTWSDEAVPYGDDPDPWHVTMESANSMWVNAVMPGLRADYVGAAERYLDAEVERLTFDDAAVERINRWCGERTHGMIPGVVQAPLSQSLMMMLVNALYVKGAWCSPFETSATAPRAFHRTDGSTQQVEMMHQQGALYYAETADCQLVGLPFGPWTDDMCYFFVLLPRAGKTADELLAGLNQDLWHRLMTAPAGMDAEVSLSLPKFRLDLSASLNAALQQMGIQRAFTPSAEFGGIVADADGALGSLYIGSVQQKTSVDVNEAGLEAAAVTMVGMVTNSMPQQAYGVTVDRPFLFAIGRRHADELLFVGKVEHID